LTQFRSGSLSISKNLSHLDLAVIAFLGACLIVGLFIFLDYGLSRDEPLFYAYADAIGYAYSIPEHLSGEFDIEQAYGPSATDHKIYGPAYLLLGRNPVSLLSAISGIRKPEFWHLVNFLTFLAGGALLYDLCKRWMSELAAFGTVLLFITQPVLWGHAFINPKDIPFMVFMLAALSMGLKMVDRLVLLSHSGAIVKEEERPIEPRGAAHKIWLMLSLILLILILIVLLFDEALRAGLSLLIQQSYDAPATSPLGRVFKALAINAAEIPAEAYIEKGLIQYERLRSAFLALSIPLLLIGASAVLHPPFVMRALHTLKDILAPLPTRPLLWIKGQEWAKIFTAVLVPGILLGLVTSIRVTGPLAGLLVLLYFLLRSERRSLAVMGLYALIALVVSYLTWPFLWDAPLQRFIEVIRHMSNNPHILPVLYNGNVFPSNELPSSYLPVMLAITLTLPAIILFLMGLLGALLKIIRRQIDWRSLVVVVLLFIFFITYVILLSPPVYDGYRHFLFILPPVFVLTGIGIQLLLEHINQSWMRGAFLILISAAGIYGLISNHPYQYTYYNALVGGTSGASRRFETDYWLTCYKEAMEAHINADPAQYPALYVLRAPAIAEYYAAPQVKVISYDPQIDQPVPGQKTLLTTRTNVDLSLFPDATALFSVGLPGADFCIVKQNQ
jgi:hypothetical protein